LTMEWPYTGRAGASGRGEAATIVALGGAAAELATMEAWRRAKLCRL
jgi:hypothetical protein